MDDLRPPAGADHGATGERVMQDRLGTRARADQFYARQVLDHLNEPMRAFVRRQEMMFLATSGAGGACDSTLRAGPPGFVVVLDERRLAWPEYRGNGVLASLGNIVENPHVGLLFVDFVRDIIGLHVNGSATVVPDAELRAEHPDLPVDQVPGRRAEQWVVAQVHEAYIHCSKHIPRLGAGGRDRPHLGHQAAARKSDFFVAESGGPGHGGTPARQPAPAGAPHAAPAPRVVPAPHAAPAPHVVPVPHVVPAQRGGPGAVPVPGPAATALACELPAVVPSTAVAVPGRRWRRGLLRMLPRGRSRAG
jgi:hypothetical protein